LAPLQPPICAADAGTVEHKMAAIAAAPSNLLIMLLSSSVLEQTQRHCWNL
jgi:hypothetical protein